METPLRPRTGQNGTFTIKASHLLSNSISHASQVRIWYAFNRAADGVAIATKLD
jgi:hypothetical protein